MIRRALSLLYVQVLIAIVLGIAVGVIWPHTGEAMRPLGDGFVKLADTRQSLILVDTPR